MFLKRLIKAIFLFKGVKNGFLVINCIICFWLLIVKIFKEKIFKNHTLGIFLRGGALVLLYSGDCAVLIRHLVLHRYFGYYNSREYHQTIVNIGTFMIYLVDLGAYCRSKDY